MQQLRTDGFCEFIITHSTGLQPDDSECWRSISERRLVVVLGLRRQGQRGVSAVADRLQSQHATVCAVDRFWSDIGNLCPANRTRLAVEKGNKMMLVRNTCRLANKLTRNDSELERAFWVGQLAGELDVEDVEDVE
jgi:hypothetical protein